MAISFQGLGNEGRLGNQMFQYAFLRGVAANRGFDWMIPGPDADRFDNYGLFEAFQLTGCNLQKNTGEKFFPNNVEYRDMHFNEEIFNECQDNTNFSGNFQTEKYFSHIADSIRDDFTFRNCYLEPCKEFIDSLGGKDKCIFLHVRRGSPNLTGRRGEKWSYQMVQEYHPLCKEDYYKKALEHFPLANLNVIVVSDLIDWCKKQSFLQGDNFHFSDSSYEIFGDGASVPYIDLCLMSLCGGGIIANSSLSWWGAWLMQDPKYPIVAPDPWFGPAYAHYNMKDMIPERWIKIHNDPTPITPES